MDMVDGIHISENSIVAQARRHVTVEDSGSGRVPLLKIEKSGVYVDLNSGGAAADADGYIRRSPVQELVVSPEYRRNIIKRVIAAFLITVVATAVVVAAMYIFLHYEF